MAKLALGWLLALGVGWCGLFMAAAAPLALVALSTWFSLKDSPASVGLPMPPASRPRWVRGGPISTTQLFC